MSATPNIQDHSAELVSSPKRRPDTWMTSFADIITVLLCFFIIFFNSGKGDVEKENVLSKLSIFFSDKAESQLNHASTSQPPSTVADSHDGQLPEFQDNINNQVPGAVLTKLEDSVIVDFTNVNFFRSGSSRLNRDGYLTINKFLKIIEPHKNKLLITVRGHTDATKLNKNKKRIGERINYAHNTELSVFRALAVRDFLVQRGFLRDNVFVTGMGEAEGNINNTTRRVSFKLEAKQ